jgi:alpha-beta hydrolase superfamily lysophospholipase
MSQEQVRIQGLICWIHSCPTPKGRVVIVHGLGEHSGRHSHTIEALNSASFEVIRFDLRGCGKSDGIRQWINHFDDYVEDLNKIMAYVAERPPLATFVLGHSLGGALSVRYASQNPKAIKGLILSAPAYIPGGGVSKIKIFIGRILNKLTPSMRISGGLDVTAISRDPDEVARYQSDELVYSFNTVRQGTAILNALPNVPIWAGSIEVPTLILHGDKDRLVSHSGSEKILEALSSTDKKLETFPDGAHELHNDLDRTLFFKTIVEWLTNHIQAT